jgi:hypothetical protein
MGSSQFDSWLASEVDTDRRLDEVDPRERVQSADETRDEEWRAFLDEQGEDDWEARWSDPAWLAYVEREAAMQCGESA